jgi:predicted alpha/beta hydrolase
VGVAAEEVAVRRFPATRPWASLVIAGAMGVRQDFYAPIARYFAANGLDVATFDYRGMGFSRAGSLRGFEADVGTWAEQDLQRVIDASPPGLPLVFLGHSLGGQILGVPSGNAAVKAAITVTAGSGWYKLNDRMPAQVRFFWFVAIPALTPLFGYFPGKALRMVGDLPRGVAYQWRKWCLHPDYLLSEGERYRASFDRVRSPIRSYSFEDDPLINRAAVDSLHAFYRNAALERCHLDRGGHFGFFSAGSQPTLWAESLRWLRDKVHP